MCKAHDVPPEPPATTAVPPDRAATAVERPLSVAFDATPLLGRPTGVGAFCAGALEGLAGRDDVAMTAFAVSWRRRHGIDALVPTGVHAGSRPMPARPLHAAWGRGGFPPVEWFVGPADVVHGSNFVVPPTSSAARVVTVHDLTVVRFPELCDAPTLAYPRLIRRAVADGAWIHTPSAFVAEEVVDLFGVDPGRVRAVHHGVPDILGTIPSTQSTEHETPLALPPGCGRYVLAIGTVEPRKDYPLLVEAFGAVAAAHPDVALVIVGGDGWGADAFDEALRRSTVRSRVVRPGYLDGSELADVLRGATVLAYPSRYEGFGFPPLQAMAVGVPVVATSAGAVPEVVGDAAWLVPPGDEDALAARLVEALDGGDRVEAMIDRGHHHVQGFSWEACAAGLSHLYRDAAQATGRPA